MDERRIIVTSDTHGMHDELDIESWPEADIFIHAGDFTMDCNPKEL
jgi:predicted phosphodiesterase